MNYPLVFCLHVFKLIASEQVESWEEAEQSQISSTMQPESKRLPFTVTSNRRPPRRFQLQRLEESDNFPFREHFKVNDLCQSEIIQQ